MHPHRGKEEGETQVEEEGDSVDCEVMLFRVKLFISPFFRNLIRTFKVNDFHSTSALGGFVLDESLPPPNTSRIIQDPV